MVGLGARRSNTDTKYVQGSSEAQSTVVSGGVSSGRLVQPFYGVPGPPDNGGNGDAATARWVWILTVGAGLYLIGVHHLLGKVRAAI